MVEYKKIDVSEKQELTELINIVQNGLERKEFFSTPMFNASAASFQLLYAIVVASGFWYSSGISTMEKNARSGYSISYPFSLMVSIPLNVP